MRKKGNINFKRNYKVRETPVKLLFRVFVIKLFFVILGYISHINLNEYYVVAISLIEFAFVAWVFLIWISAYYIVAERGISKTKGVIFRRTRTLKPYNKPTPL